jgi:hypothetical protein
VGTVDAAGTAVSGPRPVEKVRGSRFGVRVGAFLSNLEPQTSNLRRVLIVMLALGTSAHVGSPNVFFDGTAGPYAVRVIVRPPEVIPGLADITVRLTGDTAGVRRVVVRPVYWTTGTSRWSARVVSGR